MGSSIRLSQIPNESHVVGRPLPSKSKRDAIPRTPGTVSTHLPGHTLVVRPTEDRQHRSGSRRENVSADIARDRQKEKDRDRESSRDVP